MSDSALEDCDGCGKKNVLKRIISGGTGMVFKGSGFYLTDYTQYGKKPKKATDKNKTKKNKEKKKE